MFTRDFFLERDLGAVCAADSPSISWTSLEVILSGVSQCRGKPQTHVRGRRMLLLQL